MLAATYLKEMGGVCSPQSVYAPYEKKENEEIKLLSLKEVHFPSSGFIVTGSGDGITGLWARKRYEDTKAPFARQQEALKEKGVPLTPFEAWVVPFPYFTGCPAETIPCTRDADTAMYYYPQNLGSAKSSMHDPFTIDEATARRGVVHQLLKCDETAVFDNHLVEAAVQFKWESFAQARFLGVMSWYLISLALLTASIFLVGDAGLSGFAEPREVAAVGVFIVLGLFSLRDTWQEIAKVKRLGFRTYLSGPWHVIQATVNALTILSVVGALLEWNDTRVILAIAIYLKWFELLYFFQAFETTGPLVRMVIQIVVDMRWIIIVIGVALVASACALYVLLHPDDDAEGFGDPADTLFTIFNMLLLLSFDTTTFAVGRYAVLVRILFVLSTILVAVVLLNLLIGECHSG